MTEDERKNVWTVESLRIHLTTMLAEEARIRSLDVQSARESAREQTIAQHELFKANLIATERAVTKAEAAAEKRLDSMNEFRQSLSDQSMKFMPRAETDAKLDALAHAVTTLRETQDKAMNVLGGEIDKVSERVKIGDSKYGGMLTIGAGVMAVLAAISAIATVIIAIVRK